MANNAGCYGFANGKAMSYAIPIFTKVLHIKSTKMNFKEIKSLVPMSSPEELVNIAIEFDKLLQSKKSIEAYKDFNNAHRQDIDELKYVRTDGEELEEFKQSLERLLDGAIALHANV